jgi:hypothetical protein
MGGCLSGTCPDRQESDEDDFFTNRRNRHTEEQKMARFISLHTLACLTRQGAEELTLRLQRGPNVKARRVLVNLYEGKMLVEFEAEKRDTIDEWFREQAIHFDWLMRVELESIDGGLRPATR